MLVRYKREIEKVIISGNCPENVIDDLNYYTSINKTKTLKVDYPNTELGVICKKPFSISVLGILKEG